MRILLDAQTKPDVVSITRPLFAGGTHVQTFSSEWSQTEQRPSRIPLGIYSAVRPRGRSKDLVSGNEPEVVRNIARAFPGARLCENHAILNDFMPDSDRNDFGTQLVLAMTAVEFQDGMTVLTAKPGIPGRFHYLSALDPRSVYFEATVSSRHQAYLTEIANQLPMTPNGAVQFNYAAEGQPHVLDITVDLMTTRYLAMQIALLMARAVGQDSKSTQLISQRDFAIRAAATECVVLSEFARSELHLFGEGAYEVARDAVRAIATTAAEVDAFMARHVRDLASLSAFPGYRIGAAASKSPVKEEIGERFPEEEDDDLDDAESEIEADKSIGSDESAPPTPPEPSVDTDRMAFETVMAELDKLVGLASVKAEVETLFQWMIFQRDRVREGQEATSVTMHLVFVGNPGTGKTTVARLIGDMYKALGMLTKGHTVETDRAGLVATYLGQTEKKTTKVFNSALDGVLFIDEAYALSPKSSYKDYGSDAINRLIPLMENNRSRICVIVAGYPKEMEDFFATNPGMMSRFNIQDAKDITTPGKSGVIHFEDYRPEELLEIFRRLAASEGFEIDDEAKKVLAARYEDAYSGRTATFGNGRFVRNHLEQTLKRVARRHVKGRPTDNVIHAQDVSE